MGKGFNFFLGEQKSPHNDTDKDKDDLKEVTELAILILWGEWSRYYANEAVSLVQAAKRSVCMAGVKGQNSEKRLALAGPGRLL